MKGRRVKEVARNALASVMEEESLVGMVVTEEPGKELKCVVILVSNKKKTLVLQVEKLFVLLHCHSFDLQLSQGKPRSGRRHRRKLPSPDQAT